MDQSFPKARRLPDSKAFGRVFKRPDFRVSSPHILILARAGAPKTSRLGIVISKKHVSISTQRNRLKRIIRESFRSRKNDFAIIDFVVLVKKGLSSLENREIRAQLQTLFTQAAKKARK